MTEYLKDLSKEFRKVEFHDIAVELEIDVPLEYRILEVIRKIVDSLDTDGVPESVDCSELLSSFLLVAGYIDENGNLIEDDEDTDKGDEKETISEETVIEKPRCYSLADDRDPSCARCKLLDDCMISRLAKRPECFGILWDPKNEECKSCFELYKCGIEYAESNKLNK